LSLAVVGAILTPVATGSLKKADRESWGLHIEDDRQRYLVAHGANPFTCMVAEWISAQSHTAPRYANENDQKLCDESENLRGENVTEKWVFNRTAFVPLLRDVLLGFLAPLIIVFVAPPIAAAYFRWVTKPPK
jgi:hypothetical protein